MLRKLKNYFWLFVGAIFLMAATVTSLTYLSPVPVTGAAPSGYTGYTVVTGEDSNSAGTAWPSPRFLINENGTPADITDDTVIDQLTGLEWLRDANAAESSSYDVTGLITWDESLTFIGNLNSGNYGTRNAGYTDWRLPNIIELQSLISYGVTNPVVSDVAGTGKCSSGDPFYNLQTYEYWSSTPAYAFSTTSADAHTVNFGNGRSYPYYFKSNSFHVLPVRGNAMGGKSGGTASSVQAGDATVTAFTSSKNIMVSPATLTSTYGITDRTLVGEQVKDFTATCAAGALCKFRINFSGVNSVIGGLYLLKLKGGTSTPYGNIYSSAPADAASGKFYVTESDGTTLVNTGATLSPTKEYIAWFYIQDGDTTYDDNTTGSNISDPVGVFVLGAPSGGGGSGGGMAGSAGEDDWSVQSCELSRGASAIGMIPLLFTLGLLMLLSRKRKSRD